MAVDLETDMQENNKDVGRAEDDVGISGTLDMFREHEEVHQMLASIEKVVHAQSTAEKAFENFKTILDYYQVLILLTLILVFHVVSWIIS